MIDPFGHSYGHRAPMFLQFLRAVTLLGGSEHVRITSGRGMAV
jgi:hypothetical protein